MTLEIKRQVVLDTETTGMNHSGCFYNQHRIIEIGAVEIINRRLTGNNFHTYIQPNRLINPQAFSVHGISDIFLKNKPIFGDIAKDFLNYISGAELIIHNASFDIGFINYELSMLNLTIKNVLSICNIIDTLLIARKLFPGKKNTLDALCLRYDIDNSNRSLHSAITDAKLLAMIYLLMTSRQNEIHFINKNINNQTFIVNNQYSKKNFSVHIQWATKNEIEKHKEYLKFMISKNKKCIWN